MTVVLLNLVLVGYQFWPAAQTSTQTLTEEAVAPLQPQAVSKLTGELVDEAVVGLVPVSAMIDNAIDARPARGLSSADLVWEMMVEGGVTRLYAVWQTNKELEIGPVRSAREYYLPYVAMLDALYAHSGGSPAALQLLKSKNFRDGDEFRYGASYYRRADKYAPHHLYTTTTNLLGLKNSQSAWQPTYNLVFDAHSKTGESASQINIDFSSPTYLVQWKYDEATKMYLRWQADKPVLDENNGQQITAQNVIILFANIVPAPRDKYNDAISIETVGSGKMIVLSDGVQRRGQWQKKSLSSALELLDENKQPLALTSGNSWFAVVDKNFASDVVVF